MNKRVRKARWRKMVLVFTYYCSPSSISSWWLASLLLTYSVSSFIFLKAGGNHFPEWVWSCANSVLFSHCYWPCFSPEVWELQSFVCRYSPFTGAPNLPVITSKKFPTLVSTLLKMIPLFWLLKWVAMEAMNATWKNVLLSQSFIKCTCVEESATLFFPGFAVCLFSWQRCSSRACSKAIKLHQQNSHWRKLEEY